MSAAGVGVVTELRLILRACNIDGDLGAGSVFFEEAIGGFQQHALPSANLLRNCGLHLRCAGEVEDPSHCVVSAVEMDVRSRNVVIHGWQCENAALKCEIT